MMDEKTKMTALDAFSCKYSACKQGYISSVFTEAMRPHLESPVNKFQKRSVMMHRGYYGRVKSQEHTIDKFLEITSDCEHGRQVVFLGSGYDPLGLEIAQRHRNCIRIIEVDFPDVIRKKSEIYRKVPMIQSLLTQLAQENSTFVSPALPTRSVGSIDGDCPMSDDLGVVKLVGCDLRDTDTLKRLLQDSNISFSPVSPTLFITECVLVYMSSEHSSALISLFSEDLLAPSTPALWISYDMVHPEDTYGKMMLKNLRRAGFLLPGFESCPNPEAQCQRFLSHSTWTEAHSQDMLFIYRNILDEEDKERINHLEIMDEVEEWNMLMEHYTLTIAARVPRIAMSHDATKTDDQTDQTSEYHREYTLFLEMTRTMMTYDPLLHPAVRPVQFPRRK